MKDKDIDRIIRFKLAPINISVHTTNPELRCKMLNNRFAGRALKMMDRLYAVSYTHLFHAKGYLDYVITTNLNYRPAELLNREWYLDCLLYTSMDTPYCLERARAALALCTPSTLSLIHI